MRTFVITLSLISSFWIAACATAVSPPREAYILARDHGWIELTVADADVPAMIPSEGESYTLRPPRYKITVWVDNERFVADAIYPIGELPPYRVNIGFRFPTATGEHEVKVDYYGCDVQDEGVSLAIGQAIVTIQKGFVTPIRFDGTSLQVDGLRESSVVTLDVIDKRLERVEQLLETR